MQKVKEMSKQAKKFLDKSAQKRDEADVAEILQLQSAFEESKKLGETAITELMSDEIQPHISNSEQLAEKLFGYQDLYEKALQLIEKKVEEQRKIEAGMAAGARGGKSQQAKPERKNSFNSEDNENVDEGIAREENRIAVSKTSMGGRVSRMGAEQPIRQSMMTNTTNAASEIQFQFAGPPSSASKGLPPPRNDFQSRAGGFDTNVNQANPYDFDDFGGGGGKGMFSTFSNKA